MGHLAVIFELVLGWIVAKQLLNMLIGVQVLEHLFRGFASVVRR